MQVNYRGQNEIFSFNISKEKTVMSMYSAVLFDIFLLIIKKI